MSQSRKTSKRGSIGRSSLGSQKLTRSPNPDNSKSVVQSEIKFEDISMRQSQIKRRLSQLKQKKKNRDFFEPDTESDIYRETEDERETTPGDINTRMLDIVHSYTRPGQQSTFRPNQSLDLQVQPRLKEEDFFSQGLFRAQRARADRMRNKLNQSVDIATLKQQRIEKNKERYHDLDVYKQI